MTNNQISNKGCRSIEFCFQFNIYTKLQYTRTPFWNLVIGAWLFTSRAQLRIVPDRIPPVMNSPPLLSRLFRKLLTQFR